jgi:hypothetical protein
MGLFDGGIFGGNGGGSSGSATTTTTTEPWAEQKPFLLAGFQRAGELAEGAQPRYFPASTVTPFATETEQSLRAQAERARTGSPVLAEANRQAVKTLTGDFLNQNTNPALGAAIDKAFKRAARGTDSRFIEANRYGSEGHKRRLDELSGDIATDFGYRNYADERARQDAAISRAPALAAADYGDIDRLAGVGGQRESLGEAQLQDLINRFNFGETVEQRKLNDYMGTIRGSGGGTTATTSPIYRNRLIGALGGAATGASLGNTLGFDPTLAALLGAGAGAFY